MDSGFRLRVDNELRYKFVTACRASDRPAAQVLRDFMRDYVAKHYAGIQENLFTEDKQVATRT